MVTINGVIIPDTNTWLLTNTRGQYQLHFSKYNMFDGIYSWKLVFEMVNDRYLCDTYSSGVV